MPRHGRRRARRLERLRAWSTFDWSPDHRPPAFRRFALATAVALVGSLAADALVVAVAVHLYPGLHSYAHFSPVAWGALTFIGVLGASCGWPVVAAFTRRPRWLFSWMAMAVTLVLWLPDLVLLGQGNPGRAVAALMTMHLAIAVVTFESLVRLAPERPHQRPWLDDTVDALVGTAVGTAPVPGSRPSPESHVGTSAPSVMEPVG